MAFPVAVQSAVFYFLACTPCMAARARYRTRQQARREREERARLDAEEPQLYRQPSPFNVNPYWAEEITMGPSLPKKGRGGRNTSQRKLTSADKESSAGTRSSLAVSSRTAAGTAAAAASAAVPNAQESPTLVPDDARSMSVGGSDGWNHKRYQREDEELWGFEQSRTHKLMEAIVKAGSSAGRLLEGKLGKDRPVTDEDRANFYAAPIHPPVNDYHPPVVTSKPAHKDALKWMLQPPPPAKVMEGKVPVSRSTSMASSIGRRTAAGSDASLGRRMGERMVEAKLRRGDSTEVDRLPVPSPSRPLSRRSTASPRTRSQRARSGSLSTDSDGSSEGGPRHRRRRAHSYVVTPEVDSEDEEDEYFSRPVPPADTHAAQRPKLETIMSSDASSRVDFAAPEEDKKKRRKKENISLLKHVEDARSGLDVSSDPGPVADRPTGASIDSGLALSA